MLSRAAMDGTGTARKVVPALGVAMALILGTIASTSHADREDRSELDAPSEPAASPAMGAPAAGATKAPSAHPSQPVAADQVASDTDDWRLLGAREPEERQTVRGFVKHRMLHFTFDDGPHLETTPQLLESLAEYNIKATFFVVGRQFGGPRGQERRALLQRIDEEGHTIATHTQSHRDLRGLTPEQIAQDLERVERSLQETLGYRPGLFRPPYGGRTTATNTLLRNRGYTQILWNIPPETGGGPQSILRSFRRIMDRQERHHRGPGGIILLHDPNADSVNAFPLLMEEIRRRNCELLNQEGEELWDIVDDLRPYLDADEEIPADVISRRQVRVRAAAAEYCAAGDDAPDELAEPVTP